MRHVKPRLFNELGCPCLPCMLSKVSPHKLVKDVGDGMVLRKLLSSFKVYYAVNCCIELKIRGFRKHMPNVLALSEHILHFRPFNDFTFVVYLAPGCRKKIGFVQEYHFSNDFHNPCAKSGFRVIAVVKGFCCRNPFQIECCLTLRGAFLLFLPVPCCNKRIEIFRHRYLLVFFSSFFSYLTLIYSLSVIQFYKFFISNLFIFLQQS